MVENPNAGEENEPDMINEYDRLKAFIEKHNNSVMHIGGIVTQAEEVVSSNGNPFGRYVIEDYSGSYKLALFGENYKNFASMLKQNMYVYISGSLQQRGAGRQYFKEKKLEDAEYEFNVTNIDIINDIQKRVLDRVTLRIPIESVTQEFVYDLTAKIQEHPGSAKLRVVIIDPARKYQVSFSSQSNSIRIDKDLYHWLKEQNIDFSIN